MKSFLARKIPNSGNSQKCLELEEQHTESILMFFLLSGCTFYGRPKLDELVSQHQVYCSH